MSTFHEDDSEIRNLMEQGLRSDEVSPELKGKLRSMAAATKVRQPSVWRSRLAFGGIGAAAVIAVAMVMTMTPTTAMGFQRVINAVKDANAFEFTVESNVGNQNHGIVIAAVDGKFGVRADDGMILQFDRGKMEVYDAKKNEVTEFSFAGVMDPTEMVSQIKEGVTAGLKDLDLRKMLTDYETQYGKENIHIGPITHKFGKSTYQVDLQKPGDPSRVSILVNAETDLPERLQVYKLGDNGDWSEQVVLQMRYGGDVDVNLVNSATFPANAKHVQLDFGKMIGDGIDGKFDSKSIKEDMKKGFESMFHGLGRGRDTKPDQIQIDPGNK
jgi:hypothetical protein